LPGPAKKYRDKLRVQAEDFFTTTDLQRIGSTIPPLRAKNRDAGPAKKFSGGWVRNLG
jgi:hypothetical protein